MQGFYKLKSDGETFHCAPNRVFNQAFGLLTKDDPDKETMEEVDGWKWFNSTKEAHEYFGVSYPITTFD